MRVIVSGSRDWVAYGVVFGALNSVCGVYDLMYDPPDEYGNTMPDPSKITVVHGACPSGADHFADEWCISNFFEAERHPADWSHHDEDCPAWHRGMRICKRAGFRRNKEMIDLGADLLLAFWKNESPGTKQMVDLAEAARIPVSINRWDRR